MISEADYFKGPDPRIGHPIPWEKTTMVEGPTVRHLEALWAEIKQLKERVERLEDRNHRRDAD